MAMDPAERRRRQKEWNKTWRDRHPGESAKRAKAWRTKNPERAVEGIKAWRAKNPDWVAPPRDPKTAIEKVKAWRAEMKVSGRLVLHSTWAGIKQRCMNEQCKDYPRYGGRGITLHGSWMASDGFEAFEAYVLETLGPRPNDGMTLDRIDNDAGYFPGNLHWATKLEQARNRRPPLGAPRRKPVRGATFKS